MDRSNLKGGDRWKDKIFKALKSDDCVYFITVQSERSISKRGMFQKELKTALKMQEEERLGQKFILPVKIDGCSVSPSVEHFQWIDFSQDYGIGLTHLLNELGSIRTFL